MKKIFILAILFIPSFNAFSQDDYYWYKGDKRVLQLKTDKKFLLLKIKEAGKYSITFDASSLASGVYFYRIDAGKFSQTKRLVLVK